MSELNNFNSAKFNGQSIQYYIAKFDNNINEVEEDTISKLLSGEAYDTSINIKELLPKNCILFTELTNYCQMYLIDDDGNNKQIKFPVSFEKVEKQISDTEVTLIKKINDDIDNAKTDLTENLETYIKDYAYSKDTSNEKYVIYSYLGDNYYTKSIIESRLADKANLSYVYSKTQSDAKYQPKGQYLTEHQKIKTLNNKSLVGTGNISLKTINGNSLLVDPNNLEDNNIVISGGSGEVVQGLTGPTGPIGPTGQRGPAGEDGQTPTFEIGTIITSNPGTNASVSINDNSTDVNIILDFTIPRGAQGPQGATGVTGPKGDTGATGTFDYSSFEITGDGNVVSNITGAENKIIFEKGITASETGHTHVKADITDFAHTHVKADITDYDTLVGVSTSANSSNYLATSVVTHITTNGHGITTHTSNLSRVAITGSFNDLENTPDMDRYKSVWAKASRFTSNGHEKIEQDSVRRVIYSLNPITNDQAAAFNRELNGAIVEQSDNTFKYKNGDTGELTIITNITSEMANYYNLTLVGAIKPNKQLTLLEANDVNGKLGTSYNVGDQITEADAYAYNETLSGHILSNTTITKSIANLYNRSLQGAILSGEYSEDVEVYYNPWNGEVKFIQNNINGYHSIAMGWGDQIEGNHSVAEGKMNEIYGNYSHTSGNETKVHADYSFGGGIDDNDITTNEYPKDNYIVNGNYSFGYGKNIRTYNNGEVAFGQYNDSKTIDVLRVPVINNNAYDNKHNKYKIIDFSRIDVDPSLVDITSEKDLYYNIFKYYTDNYPSDNITDISTGTYYNQTARDFIEHLFTNKCSIVYNNYWKPDFDNPRESFNYFTDEEKITSINDFLTYCILPINIYRSNYEYTYDVDTSYHMDSNNNDTRNLTKKCICGVIGQKYNNDNTLSDEYEFFIWGPNSLYYDDEQITMFSIGNGNIYERNNLFEITNDGDIYYDNGKKHLFGLEDEIDNIRNIVSANPNSIDNYINSSSYSAGVNQFTNIFPSSSNYSQDLLDNSVNLLVPININTPSPLEINSSGYDKEYITLFINELNANYLKKSIIIDSNIYPSNINYTPQVLFISDKNGQEYKYNICINHVDDEENTYSIENDNIGADFNVMKLNTKVNNIKTMYKIDIEVINSICLVNTTGYFQNGQFTSQA